MENLNKTLDEIEVSLLSMKKRLGYLENLEKKILEEREGGG
jgi:hypothetical protein